MNKKYTATLSAKELEIIEKLIAKYGSVVDFSDIHKEFGKTRNKQKVKNFISKLVNKAWLVRIKRAKYYISDISGRGSIDLNQSTIAQIIDHDSYVSFEAALQHHGLFDQYLRIITSLGKKRTYERKIADWTFKFIKTKKNLFKDFEEYNLDGHLVKIASKEKVIIDFLSYRRTIYDVDLIIEKLQNYRDEFSSQKLIEISESCSITVKRMLGVVLDIANINSDKLYIKIKDNKNHSFMNGLSDKFNAKWRIYIDKKLVIKKSSAR